MSTKSRLISKIYETKQAPYLRAKVLTPEMYIKQPFCEISPKSQIISKSLFSKSLNPICGGPRISIKKHLDQTVGWT